MKAWAWLGALLSTIGAANAAPLPGGLPGFNVQVVAMLAVSASECRLRSKDWTERAIALYADDAIQKLASADPDNSPFKQPEAARRYMDRVITNGREWAQDMVSRYKESFCDEVKDAPGLAKLDDLIRSEGGPGPLTPAPSRPSPFTRGYARRQRGQVEEVVGAQVDGGGQASGGGDDLGDAPGWDTLLCRPLPSSRLLCAESSRHRVLAAKNLNDTRNR